MYLSTSRPLNRCAAGVLALVVLASLPAVSAAQDAPRGVGCEACVVVDSDGKVLWGRAIHRQLPNASTTKMMTALVVVEEARQRELVTVQAEAAAVGGGGLDLSTGEVYSVKDLLYALLLDSSNEAAAALALHVGDDMASFVAAMNDRAAELGADDTSFANPHGLDQSGHHSTAADLALIAAEVLDTPALARIVATPAAPIATPGGSVVVQNRNVLLETYRGAIGVKTGQTLGAGNVLVAAARRGPHLVIAVAMRSADAAADARVLLDHGFEKVKAAARRAREREREAAAAAAEPGVVLAAREHVGALVFDPAGATRVLAAAEVEAPDLLGGSLEITFTPSAELLLPLVEGEEIGTVEVMSGDAVIATVPALAQDPVDSESPSWPARALSGLLRGAAFVVNGINA